MKISRVLVYVGVVTGVCGLGLNSGKSDKSVAIETEFDLFHKKNLWVYGPNINTFLEKYEKSDTVESLNIFNGNEVLDMAKWVCKFTSLKSLYLAGIQVTDISNLPCLTNLEKLDLSVTCVNNISSLVQMPLKYLNLKWTPVEKVSALNVEELLHDPSTSAAAKVRCAEAELKRLNPK